MIYYILITLTIFSSALSDEITSIDVPSEPLNIAKTEVLLAEESSPQIDGKLLPSVKNIYDLERQKIKEKIESCAESSSELATIYKLHNIEKIIDKNFTIKSSCNDITSTFEVIQNINNKMQELTQGNVCNLDKIDVSTLSRIDVELRKAKVEKDYHAIITEYTKYFSYNDDVARLEECINYYNNFIVIDQINDNFISINQGLEDYREILRKYHLRGFYGDNGNIFGITNFIDDIENGEVTISQLSQYAILESSTSEWKLAGAMENFLIYKHSTEQLIAVPFVSGVSYTADALPYNLFIVEKKIEFPKRSYSIFVLKPLK